MSDNKPPRRLSSQFKLAREIVRRDMHSYDLVNAPRKYATEHVMPVAHRSTHSEEHDALVSASATKCAHGAMLFHPCTKCERSIEDCQVYLRDAQSRIKALLSKLPTIKEV